jgi:hypothetical protein
MFFPTCIICIIYLLIFVMSCLQYQSRSQIHIYFTLHSMTACMYVCAAVSLFFLPVSSYLICILRHFSIQFFFSPFFSVVKLLLNILCLFHFYMYTYLFNPFIPFLKFLTSSPCLCIIKFFLSLLSLLKYNITFLSISFFFPFQ